MNNHIIRKLRENYSDLPWWRDQLRRRINAPLANRLTRNSTGIQVTDEDWDNLIVLDACRADLFEDVLGEEPFDEYRRVTSKASATSEWTKKNFAGRELGDIVYVSGNPYTSKFAANSFRELIEVWRTEFNTELGTVLPEPLIKAAVRAVDRYPRKRLITHFMQPHHPFITRPDVRFDGWSAVDEDGDIVVNHNTQMTPWTALEKGLIDRDTVWSAYRENLETVIEDVLAFAKKLPGRTVITSDHGNAFGERLRPIPIRVYGHPANANTKSLKTVPWAVLDDGERRAIVDDGVTLESKVDSEVMSERLKSLGYV